MAKEISERKTEPSLQLDSAIKEQKLPFSMLVNIVGTTWTPGRQDKKTATHLVCGKWLFAFKKEKWWLLAELNRGHRDF